MKKIANSKRILVGWGRKRGKLCYFLSHKTLKRPVFSKPEELKEKIAKLVTSIDKGMPKKDKSQKLYK